MADPPVSVVDTNVLLNLATPVVDPRPDAPTGADPLKTVLVTYDVHTPAVVLEEIGAAIGGDDRLAAAADLVLRAAHRISVHDVEPQLDAPLDTELDRGEAAGIQVANDLDADLFITDEFSSTNYLFISLALADRNTLFTTPHVLCKLAADGVLDPGYVDAALTYYVETKHWDAQYIDLLRGKYLSD